MKLIETPKDDVRERFILLAILVLIGMTEVTEAQIGIAPQPPSRYTHKYQGKLSVTTMPLDRVKIICRSAQARGCAFVGKGHCRIILSPEGTSMFTYASRLRHELGHCNGWSIGHGP